MGLTYFGSNCQFSFVSEHYQFNNVDTSTFVNDNLYTTIPFFDVIEIVRSKLFKNIKDTEIWLTRKWFKAIH